MGNNKLNEQIYQQIKDDILTGVLEPGDALRPIREQAKVLGVSKNTVSMAYLKLADDGYVYAVQGSGYYVEQQKRLFDLRSGLGHEGLVGHIHMAGTHLYNLRDGMENVSSGLRMGEETCRNPGRTGQYFPWELWKQYLMEALDTLSKGVCAEACYQKTNALLRETVSEDLRKRRGIFMKPDNIILCRDESHAVELIRGLFRNISREITFLEPYHPAFRALFQEDAFQLKRLWQKQQEEKKENTFCVLFGYLEQYLYEYQRKSPDNLWLRKWLSETGSYLLMYDGQETGEIDFSAYEGTEFTRTLIFGNYQRGFPEELSLAYLALPDRLLRKYQNVREREERIYPLSYQIALARLFKEGSFVSILQENQRRKREECNVFKQLLANIMGTRAFVDESLSYMADGIVMVIPEVRNQTNFLKKLEDAGIYLSGAKEFWYFDRKKGESVFLVAADGLDSGQMRKAVEGIRKVLDGEE